MALASCDFFGPSIVSTAEIEREVFDRVNAHRIEAGLSPLAWDDRIAGVARGHGQDMAAGAVPFGHEGFDGRIAQIAALFPLQAAGEVVALSGSAKETVDSWISNSPHKVNLEGAYDLTGVGVSGNKKGAGYYFVQIFIRMR